MDKETIVEICEKYKKVYIVLKNKKGFSGEVKKYDSSSLTLLDRYGNDVPISYDFIACIEKSNRGKNE